MSEYDENSSEEIEFEGGFFDEGGVDVNEVPDDPYGFGKEFWPIFVVEVGPAKVTKKKNMIGMMVKFAIDHPSFQGTRFAEKLGNGNWYRLPVPVALRGQIPWDPNGVDEKKALFQLGQLYGALGFPKDQWGKINGAIMKDKRFLAKIRVSQDDQGFPRFNLQNPKPIGSEDGLDEFAKPGNSSQNGGLSPEELLKKEMEEA